MIIEVLAIGFASLMLSADISSAKKESLSLKNIDKIKSKSENIVSTAFADNSINDTTYFIGGGDEFMVALIDNPSIYYIGMVNQNCDLFLPELGIVKLGKVPLFEAKNKIINELEAKLKKKVYVSLQKIKSATVTVNGFVTQPGTYNKSGVMRILDLISIANGDTLPIIQNYNFRSVTCTNRGIVKHYDLYKYLFKGDQSQNPYIYPGDEIMLEKVNCSVFFSGDILSLSGWVPIIPDENICDLINLFQYEFSADLENIIIQRNSSTGTALYTANCSKGKEFLLQNKDIVIITKKREYPDLIMATVTGEIARPGLFPIKKNNTVAKDLIEMAGGVTKNSDMTRAVILRRSKSVIDELEAKEIRPEINSAVAMMGITRDYSVIRLNSLNVKIEPQDQIFIPKTEDMVFVSGGVKRPGAVQYEKGLRQIDYIKNAGGFQKRADKHNIFVVTSYQDIFVTKDAGEIEAGDIIVVPVSQQNKLLSTIILPIISAVATTLGVMVAIYTTVNTVK